MRRNMVFPSDIRDVSQSQRHGKDEPVTEASNLKIREAQTAEHVGLDRGC